MSTRTIFRRRTHGLIVSAASVALIAGMGLWPQPNAVKRERAIRAAIEARLNSPQAGSLFPNEAARQSMLLDNIRSFYRNCRYKPAWQNQQLDSLTATLRSAQSAGLDPATYLGSDIAAKAAGMPFANENAAADLDLQATSAFMLYGLHLSAGSIDPSTLGDTGIQQRCYPDLESVLRRALNRGTIRRSLSALEPRSIGYAQLQGLLGAYRTCESAGGWPVVPTERYLRHGDSGPAVRALRTRLWMGGWLDSTEGKSSREYNPSLTTAVRRFQACHGLDTTGWADQATLEALNAPLHWRIGQICANLDRFRWIPDGDTGRSLLVNIPEFVLYAREGGRNRVSMKVIVGWRMAHTPIFSDSIVAVIFHPAWTVSRSVAREELLPRLQNDPSSVSADSFAIYDGWGDSARRVNATSIDWNAINGAEMDRFKIVQLPGPTNPEGSIKFAMTNTQDIYLHASPATELFTWNNRGMSHGCIRLEHPFELARYLLSGMGEWDSASIARALANSLTRSISLSRRVHALIVYKTAFIDAAGFPNFRPDIYGFDSLQIAIMSAKTSKGLTHLLH